MSNENNTTTTGLPASNLGREWGPVIHIPNTNGAPFKTECRRDGVEPGTLERFTVWISDDPRGEPHNHPWPFESELLSGGYTEDRYRKVGEEWTFIGTFTYRKGDRAVVPAGDAHVVYDVLPGTTTHMFIGPLVAGPKDWGHLILDTEGQFKYEPAVTTAEFLERLKVLNHRPA